MLHSLWHAVPEKVKSNGLVAGHHLYKKTSLFKDVMIQDELLRLCKRR